MQLALDIFVRNQQPKFIFRKQRRTGKESGDKARQGREIALVYLAITPEWRAFATILVFTTCCLVSVFLPREAERSARSRASYLGKPPQQQILSSSSSLSLDD